MFKVVTDPADLQRAFAVRAVVFMGEQECPYAEEFDGLDGEALHVLGEAGGEPIAAGRVRDVSGSAKLERIAVVERSRFQGVGHALVEFMIAVARERGFRRFKMHAQVHLAGFYRKHGFLPQGEIFQEAGIDHVLMVREDPDAAPGPASLHDPFSAYRPGVGSSDDTTEELPALPPVVRYAGFWRRLGAQLVDSALLALLTWPILVSHYGSEWLDDFGYSGWLDFSLTGAFPPLATIALWRAFGATPGKQLLGAWVVSERTLARPSLGQCLGRYFGYFVSLVPFGLGYLWIAGDQRKQGWHDKLAHTLVVRDRPGSRHAASAPQARPPDKDWMPF
jgi:predicted GNAT family N-acyltransferase/uncharacterized RDD family membrane protein YckC